MRITRLTISNLRRLVQVELQPGPGLNLLVGANAAGKTSVLEALHLMAYGRSFRGRVRDGLIRSGSEAVEIFVEWRAAAAAASAAPYRRAGLRHAGDRWQGRLDGADVTQLGDLCAALAVVSFEPGSHALVEGGGESRRRFMDWGLFHVEPAFLPVWRRYARALRQRNALLKAQRPELDLDAWELELATVGDEMTRSRSAYLARLERRLTELVPTLSPALGAAELSFHPGWRRQEMSLADALLLARGRDRQVGHTTVGPHRADWRVRVSAAPDGAPLSRGQAKLVAMACLLAQAADLGERHGAWPVIALDDLASELDAAHRERVLALLERTDAQVFVTGTDWAPLERPQRRADAALFHVEQGRIDPLPSPGRAPAGSGPVGPE